MNIAIVGHSPNIGGVETFILNMYRTLNDENTFYFLTSYEHLYDEEEILNNGDKIIKYCSRKKNPFKSKRDLNKIFKKYKIDVLWQNCCSLSCIDEIVAAKKAGVKKIIVHSHNSENMGSKLTAVLHLLNKKRIKKYITNSFACSDVAAKWMFPPSVYDETEIIYNAVDANKFEYNKETKKSVRKELNIKDGSIVIGHVGRFHFQKNHKFILEVFNEFNKSESNSFLVLCGEGELEFSIKEKVVELGLENKVIFLGSRNDMYRIYQCFDMMLFPSLFEGLPFALVEAQAAGVPCLISDSISKEVAITDYIIFENIRSDIKVWVRKLNDCLKIEKRSTYADIKKKGFDIFENKNKIINILLK